MTDPLLNSSQATENNPARCFGKAWADSALLAWGLAAAAFVVAAFCLVSLAWDGSYYLLGTLQDGTPMISNRRWLNWLLLTPILEARSMVTNPSELAVIHGLMCALLPLFSLAVCLRMLRGRFERLRFWVVIGILLVPLPGQMVLVSEATPTVQLAWVLFAFVWCGCPVRWSPAVALCAAAMWGLHPVSVALFFLAAASAGVLSFAVALPARRRLWIWTALFGLAFLGKTTEMLLLVSPYERANMQGATWFSEFIISWRFTPLVMLIPVLAEACWRVWESFRGDGARSFPQATKLLWGAAFLLGIIYTATPGGWVGSLCFRKFGIVIAAPLVLLAGIEAWRQWRSPAQLRATTSRPIFYPALLFAIMLCCMAFSWRQQCGALKTSLATCPGEVQTHTDLPPHMRDTALNHWSATSLSLILQGWNPEKVHVWDRSLQLGKKGFRVCPEADFPSEDKAFKLAWVAKLTD